MNPMTAEAAIPAPRIATRRASTRPSLGSFRQRHETLGERVQQVDDVRPGDMVTVHTGMGITNEEFNAIAGDLKKALDKNNVPSNLQDELIAIVETTRAQIVNK